MELQITLEMGPNLFALSLAIRAEEREGKEIIGEKIFIWMDLLCG